MTEFKNEAQRLEFQNGIKQITKGLEMMEDERVNINEIIHELYTTTAIPKPIIRNVSKLYFKKSLTDFKDNADQVTGIYNEITLPKSP